MYVTLEPCSHQGKTGPCTQAIIEAGLAKVVVAAIDPSEHAGGKGIRQLHDAGIEVQAGICETQAKLLNAPFIKLSTTGKCWVTLKWAQSIDGKLAWAQHTDQRGWISSELSRKDVHKLRRRAGGILVGINTVLADDPLLTPRPSKGRKPTRIILDSSLRIPPDCRLLATAKRCPVLICASENSVRTNPKIAEQIAKKGAELFAYPDTEARSNLCYLLDELSSRGVAQLLVEGGPKVLTSFLKENLADEIIVYIAPKMLGGSGSANMTGPMAELTQSIGLHCVETERFGDDIRLTGLTEKALNELSIAGG